MNSSSGIGGAAPTPEKVPETGGVHEMGKKSTESVLQTKVATLGQLKALLIQNYGEKEGLKFYNQFMKSFAMVILQQVQQSAEQAKKAAQSMRMDQT
jgi:hypothetical protein